MYLNKEIKFKQETKLFEIIKFKIHLLYFQLNSEALEKKLRLH